jgi:Protein of unknown function (DUF2628)
MEVESEHEKYLVAFFGDSPAYYLKANRALSGGENASFNFPAFLLGLFWFLYRKMYVFAIGIFVVLLMIDQGIQIIGRSMPQYKEALQFFSFFITLAVSIVMGFKGNEIYLGCANRKIQEITASHSDEGQRLEAIKKAGGTSLVLPWALAGAIIALFIIMGS